jgi:hypothetical protein
MPRGIVPQFEGGYRLRLLGTLVVNLGYEQCPAWLSTNAAVGMYVK